MQRKNIFKHCYFRVTVRAVCYAKNIKETFGKCNHEYIVNPVLPVTVEHLSYLSKAT
jgi:hypothetical protein